MVQGTSTAALEALRNASASIDEHIALLRQLKNDIAGHLQRKELLVKQGAIEPLVRIASSSTSEHAGRGPATDGAVWSKQDEARYHATVVLGSLASGGPQFMQPLNAAGVPHCLLSTLESTHHPKLVSATLQAVRSLAQQSRSNTQPEMHPRATILDRRSMFVFSSIMQKAALGWPQSGPLLRLVLDIITAAAVEEENASLLLDDMIWTPLVELFVVNATDVEPDRDNHLAPSRDLSSVMLTIAAIIDGSKYRTECFIHHPVMRRLLTRDRSATVPAELPEVHVPPIKNVSFNGGSSTFPALASLQSNGEERGSITTPTVSRAFNFNHAHAVCMYLLSVARSVHGLAQVAALRLSALVNNAIYAHSFHLLPTIELQHKTRTREKYLALCAVPLAIRLIQTACERSGPETMSVTEKLEHRTLKPQACEVLAALIRSSKDLQVAAVDGGAIKRICSLLKKTFDNIISTKPMWSSRPSPPGDEEAPASTCRLGDRGMPPELEYAMHCRRAALQTIAALANTEDVHRQAIVQAGVVTCIIDSLKPFTAEALDKTSKSGHQITPKDGNTTQVIIAACRAARSMSRSVSLLRTSLIDAGIAKPIFDLLKHPELQVQIAATETCCNLVLEFSPMREELLSAGVIKTLTEHARQSGMALRLSSLWALKHLMLSASRDIKMQTLEELGTGWLVAAVQGEQHEDIHDTAVGGVAVNAVGGLSAPNAAGERVDLLNPSSMDVDDPPAHPGMGDDDEDGEIMYDESSLTHYRASQLRSTLAPSEQQTDGQKYLESIREMEQNPVLRARRDDIAVQEQGLDFLRNMLNGDDCAYMLEHLFNQIGTTKLFAVLTEKLVPVTTQSSSMRNGSSRPVYAPTELILSTTNVITHIANGSPQHKQLLIAQKPLLSAWLPHFHHPDRRVRVVSVWAVNSLTWIEDEHDRPGAQQRARELREVGIVGAVEVLRNDVDLDVRERVRVAGRQIEGLA